MLPSIRTLMARRALMVGTILTLGVAGTAGTVAFTRTAAPAPSPSASAGTAQLHRARRIHAPSVALGRLIALEAKDTGQTRAQIRTALGTGKTLTEIAGSKAAQVKADALALITTRVTKAVTAKRITQAQASTLVTKATTLLDTAMSKDFSKLIQTQDARRAARAAKHGREHPTAGRGAVAPTPESSGAV
jgi:hypothetical protein